MSSLRPAPQRKPGIGAPLESSESIGARLEEMERKIERLRAIYESFFLGVERRPPHASRQELNRLMLETQQISIRNAGLRFRFQSLSQRWTLLTTYWNRTLREIESGTYRRDLQKTYRRIAARGAPLTEEEATSMGIPTARAKAFVTQQNQRWGSAPASGGAITSMVDPLDDAARVDSVPFSDAVQVPALNANDAVPQSREDRSTADVPDGKALPNIGALLPKTSNPSTAPLLRTPPTLAPPPLQLARPDKSTPSPLLNPPGEFTAPSLLNPAGEFTPPSLLNPPGKLAPAILLNPPGGSADAATVKPPLTAPATPPPLPKRPAGASPPPFLKGPSGTRPPALSKPPGGPTPPPFLKASAGIAPAPPYPKTPVDAPRSAPPPPRSNEVDLGALHRAYNEAHVRMALPGAPPTEDNLRGRIVPHLQRLQAAHPDKKLDVSVIVENGRIVLRTKPLP